MAVLVAVAGCNSDNGGKAAPNNKAILDAPPFAGVSDSIRRYPDNLSLYLRRADLLTQQAQYVLAYRDLSKVWDKSPTEALGVQLVNNLFLQGKSDEAMKKLQALQQQFPESLLLKRRMGEALLLNGQYDQAIAAYDTIIANDPNDFEAYYERATLHLNKADTAAAITDLEKSFSLQPTQLAAISLANLYAEKKNPRAVALADEVIGRDSAGELIDPVYIKGIYYANTGQSAKALEAFNQCIRMDWKFQEAYIEKGIIYFGQKNLDEALQQFKLAATVTNTFADAYFWQGRCYEALGKKEDAIANYVRAYALDKEFTEARERAEKLGGK
ncbi:tetratricopeptide repeat protein [Flavihumibacter petaseus]|nr:tetratricopeptide repeat protein [Flavihumibacter petaseus]